MNSAAQLPHLADIQVEWERIELLARCLMMSRTGRVIEESVIERLCELQQQVDLLRADKKNPWQKLPVAGLSPLALDIVACVYAVEAQPRVGLLLQDLQGSAQAFPSMAFIQVLLALENSHSRALHDLAGSRGELVKRNLIVVEGDHPFAAVRAEKSALALVLGLAVAEPTPPGAYPVSQVARWADLVLPPDRMRLLQEYMMWLRHKNKVTVDWGGHRCGGPVALFSGPSGTGKTFAACVIAGELGWPLYRVDLARLVSKYIGETEKNIGRLFDAAHQKNIVLQFDEVDALMSKRGEIKEARDRYANMEVSYLLSRIEEHDGPCVLTTNLRTQIDKAFTRRFQVVVEFPRPDSASRAQLWQRMLPPGAPRAADLDLNFIAGAVNMTGGNIRNAALHAAYLAAEESHQRGADAPITLEHIALGIWRELSKDKAQVPRSDLGPLIHHVPETIFCQEMAP
jgi:SpoVK/Ycf46/Vps4 family AAA+-type ATPase